ncbi:MAG: HNH endonuclease, partial [Nitrosopumilus sp.]|nr:HNH endonuclease [Nitrosopumilus sp.]
QKNKDAIREIQRGRCAYRGCKNTEFFEYDHIRGRDDNSLSNCQMLCMYHHRLKTNEDAIKKRIEKDLDDGKSLSEINIGSKDPVRERPRIPRRKFPTKSSYHRKNSSRKPDSRKRRR